jgi:hypothetical protein
VAVWQKQTQSQKSIRRGLTQRNSSGLLKPLEGVAFNESLEDFAVKFVAAEKKARLS